MICCEMLGLEVDAAVFEYYRQCRSARDAARHLGLEYETVISVVAAMRSGKGGGDAGKAR